MEITFYKYEGTGNDFVIIDNRALTFPKNDTNLIARLCHRRFGIGADGLILLESDKNADFRMAYFNSDGNQSTMCGNGGRCIVAFAKLLKLIDAQTTFEAIDGIHTASISADGIVSLQMKDVGDLDIRQSHIFLDTGSPHHVTLVDELATVDVKRSGAVIRYGDLYGQPGANVNFVQQHDDGSFSVRTYERGVEDETLSCGTGVTAVAIAMKASGKTTDTTIPLRVQGGKLEVSFTESDGRFTNVFLKGPATFVFKGTILC